MKHDLIFGTKAIYMPKANPLRAVNKQEQEVLLDRNLRYKVTKRTETNGKIILHLEVVP